MSLALLFHYLMLNIFRMLIHPSSGACDLFVELFHGLYCSGSMCIGVTLWFGCGGVVSVRRLRHCLRLHTDTTFYLALIIIIIIIIIIIHVKLPLRAETVQFYFCCSV